MRSKTLNWFRALFVVILSLSTLLFITGCFLPAPDPYEFDTDTLGGVVKLILRLAFTRPWILLPGLWRIVELETESGGGFIAGFDFGFQYALVVFFIGGIHFGIGALLSGGFRQKTTNFLTFIAAIFALYGLFIWTSCAGAFFLGFLLE